ncbi:YdcF family protein [candidate division TA06 bacterium]|uniref:YdcF family protein n=1 Tax=candidate division TA06 bacterium TaxID=2250710 RepID=A0A933MJX3_UNCT6|nr:YdcF family protein [candidate division TA06 bacterium]
MHWILFLSKKILSYLLNPLTIILILLAFSAFLLWQKKHKKAGLYLLLLGLVAFIFASYGFIGNSLLKGLENRYPPLLDVSQATRAKWVVVLGASMTSDPKIPLTSQLSEGSVIRAIEGIRIWRQMKGSRLIFSGGAVFHAQSEAYGMARLARQLGVPDSGLLREDKSLDTDDQARLIKEIVKGDTIILVTSAAHMLRSVSLFKKQGVALIPAPTHFLIKDAPKFKPNRLFPNSGNIQAAETLFHEYLGLAWSKLRGRI